MAEKSNIWADRRESAAEYSPIEENENAKLQKKSQQGPASRQASEKVNIWLHTDSFLSTLTKRTFPVLPALEDLEEINWRKIALEKNNILYKKWDRFRMAS